MVSEAFANRDHPDSCRELSAYLLGRVTFDYFLAMQRRLVYEIGGERTTAR